MKLKDVLVLNEQEFRERFKEFATIILGFEITGQRKFNAEIHEIDSV